MNKIRKILSVAIVISLLLSNICIVQAETKAEPFIEEFNTEGYVPQAADGYTYSGSGSLTVNNGVLILADSTTSGTKQDAHQLTLNFTSVASGVLVVEGDVVTKNSVLSQNGLFTVLDSNNSVVANIAMQGRGANSSMIAVNGATDWNSRINNANWQGTKRVKFVIDFTSKTYTAWQGTPKTGGYTWTQMIATNSSDSTATSSVFGFTATEASKLRINLTENGDGIDNIKIYKEITATQGTSSYNMLVGETTQAEIVYSSVGETMGDIVWTSSDNEVAEVSSGGIITAKAKGNAVITASSKVYDVTFDYDVNVTVPPVSVPFMDEFIEEGYIPGKTDSYVMTNPDGGDVKVVDGKLMVSADAVSSENRFLSLEFEEQSSGVLVFETDFYTTNAVAPNGLISMYDNSGTNLMKIVADGRGVGSTYVNSKDTTNSLNNINWGSSVQLFRVKVEVDFDVKKWAFYQGTYDNETITYTQLQLSDGTNYFEFSDDEAQTATRIDFCMSVAGSYIDNLKLYKKASAVSEKSAYLMYVGETETVDMVYSPVNEQYADMVWLSSDTNIAEVSSAGVITAKNSGYTIITGGSKIYDETHIFDVFVKTKAESITLTNSTYTIGVDEDLSIEYDTYPSNASIGDVTWSTSNSSIAVVDQQGVVTGISSGSATISIKGSLGLEALCTVVVVEGTDGFTEYSIGNADFSLGDATSISGWINMGGTRVSDGVHSSTGAVKIENTGYIQQNIYGLNEGDCLTLSFWMKIDSLTENSKASVTIGYWNDGTGYSYETTKYYSEARGEWEYKKIELLMPAGTDKLHILLRIEGTGEVYYDKVRLTNKNDESRIALYSGGLEIDEPVEGIGALNAKLHYVPDDIETAQVTAALYNDSSLADVYTLELTNDTISSNLNLPINTSAIKNNSTFGLFTWENFSTIRPLKEKISFPSESYIYKNDVYDFFYKERMRGVYGAIGEIYNDDTKELITDCGINTLILNITGTYNGCDVLADGETFDNVFCDISNFAEETGVKVFTKISYGSNAPVNNTLYGTFHPGMTHDTSLPCPRSEQYWENQIEDILIRAASYENITGVVVDMEMYSGVGANNMTRYTSPCMCDNCIRDFVNYYNSERAIELLDVEKELRNQYLKTNLIYNDYQKWHKSEITRITTNVRKAIHNVNPDIIIGYMPEYEWLSGITEGFGTQDMPAMIFSEKEYKGDLDFIYGYKSSLKLDNMPAVYVTGLWSSTDSAIKSENFAQKATEAGEKSLGYWTYSMDQLRSDANYTSYVEAIISANEQLDENLEIQ